MKIETLLKIVNGTYIGKKPKEELHSFSIDTRTLNPKDVFIAIKGRKLDGYDFLDEAAQKGARIAIVSQKPSKKWKHMGILLVKDTLEALHSIVSYQRKQYNIPLIAVTGSVGKSTLKELISGILEPDYKVLKNEGNQNNHIGLPLTLLKLDSRYDVIVTELGMNHPNEIETLSRLCKPTISLITNIGTSHIGNLGSKKNILKAKMEIIEGMESGILFVNGEDKYLKKVKSNHNIRCFKCGGRNSAIKIKDVHVTMDQTVFTILYQKQKYVISFPYGGRHYPILITMAILVGIEMNISIDTCIERLQKIKLLNHRLKKVELKNHISLLDDTYNASLESFDSALDLIKNENRPKLLIIGDILELGQYSQKIHLKLIKKINKMKNTEVWYIGNELKKVGKNIQMGTYFESLETIKKAIMENDWKDCIILVKGSHAMHLNEIVEFLETKYQIHETKD